MGVQMLNFLLMSLEENPQSSLNMMHTHNNVVNS